MNVYHVASRSHATGRRISAIPPHDFRSVRTTIPYFDVFPFAAKRYYHKNIVFNGLRSPSYNLFYVSLIKSKLTSGYNLNQIYLGNGWKSFHQPEQ